MRRLGALEAIDAGSANVSANAVCTYKEWHIDARDDPILYCCHKGKPIVPLKTPQASLLDICERTERCSNLQNPRMVQGQVWTVSQWTTCVA